MPEEALRQEVGAAEEREEQARHAVLLGEQPEVGLRRLQRGRELGEEPERLVGIGRRQHLLQERDSRDRIAHPREGGPPAAERLERRHRALGVGEPALERDGAAPRLAHLGIRQERQLGVELHLARARAEQVAEERRHPIAVRPERLLEPLRRVEAHRAGEAEPLPARGQGVRLPPVHHLDAVLGAAQEQVRVRERVAIARRHDAREEQPLERREHRALAQLGLLAAVQELERGDEELDLADPALAELQVTPALGARARVDARLHGLDLAQDVEVERAPPHERLEEGEELLASPEVARRRPRLHERVPLP